MGGEYPHMVRTITGKGQAMSKATIRARLADGRSRTVWRGEFSDWMDGMRQVQRDESIRVYGEIPVAFGVYGRDGDQVCYARLNREWN